jgi:hypothetical protein
MGVSLVYLGKNDKDKEMHKMCKAIAEKLRVANVEVQETNSDSQSLPEANSVTFNEIWFCGHSRYVEVNGSIRKIGERNFGGFPILEIAKFVKSCVKTPRRNFRLICCESAQQQRYTPESLGESPAGLEAVLGKVDLCPVSDPKFLRHFAWTIDARVSHLERLILCMAKLWGSDKRTSQPAFDICGLWGAGDITNDAVPISSFLQAKGSLEAVSKMSDPKVKGPQREKFEAVFKNAHCGMNRLPDFFGYSISQNVLIEWAFSKAGAAVVL